MAVFTKIKKNELENFLMSYSIGTLISFEGIVEGIENTNFKIKTTENTYILTIFEKRVTLSDIPFFITLQKHLTAHGFNCPIPIENNLGNIINKLLGKNTIITSFLEGRKIKNILPFHCKQVGSMISHFHKISKLMQNERTNSMNLPKWKEIFFKCQNINSHNKFDHFFKPMQNELHFLEKHWPTNLPSGIIHGDLFQDNIFFSDNKISGVIDFYFSCNDYYAYELAITTNAWCFDKKNKFLKENFICLLEGYKIKSSINTDEKNHFNTMLRGAAMRILVTRLHDLIFQPSDGIVVPKNPNDYLIILKWHQENNIWAT